MPQTKEGRSTTAGSQTTARNKSNPHWGQRLPRILALTISRPSSGVLISEIQVSRAFFPGDRSGCPNGQ